MKKDIFAHKSKSWDKLSRRVQSAKAVANLIAKEVELNKDMKLLDVGVGTGLLSFYLAPYVKEIVGVDNSKSMLNEFKNKKSDFECKIRALNLDISKDIIDEKFDGIISTMTLHHIKDIEPLFIKFKSLLKKDGFIALADLESEDGTFHSDNSGVYHYGFDFKELKELAKKVGFSEVRYKLAYIVNKPHRNFNVNLLIAKSL